MKKPEDMSDLELNQQVKLIAIRIICEMEVKSKDWHYLKEFIDNMKHEEQ